MEAVACGQSSARGRFSMFSQFPRLWPSTAKTLLDAVGKRDPQAWDEFVWLYAGGIYQRVRRMGFQAFDAANLVQEVLTSVYLNIEKFERDGMAKKFRYWLAAILRNAARDEWRQARRRNETLGQIQSLDGVEVPGDVGSGESESNDGSNTILPCVVEVALEEARRTFSGPRWQAFWLKFSQQDRTFGDIATEVGMTEHAARQAHYYILKWLKKRLVGKS